MYDKLGVMCKVKLGIIEKDIALILSKLKFDFKKLENQRILITGSSGHLGTYFTCLMLYIKKVHGINFSISCTSSGLLPKILMNQQSEFEFIKGDLTKIDFIANFQNYDSIIHLAGYAQPKIFLEDYERTIKINTRTTMQLLEKLIPGGNLLFISSSEIYTGIEKINPTEQDCGSISSHHPRAPYVISKKLGEVICVNSKRYSDSRIVIARLAMTFGPGIGANDSRAVSQFFKQGVMSKRITLLDKGLAKRRYLYVADAVTALFNILFLGENGIYNIGATLKNEISIYEIAKIIANQTESELFISTDNENILNARDSVSLSINKYEEKFGEIESINVQTGIIKTLEWIQSENIFSVNID